ncbi:CIC11C00000003105 [Sungouiella intermedia]|uniref:CIC11C00000003105 n=1 Tax=Sungouiella intermedia TaxID=45354 RepID=A0A1L0DLQ8_9ASCO|nr:CIC11C00000003105 [[Candida] intermedia]
MSGGALIFMMLVKMELCGQKYRMERGDDSALTCLKIIFEVAEFVELWRFVKLSKSDISNQCDVN